MYSLNEIEATAKKAARGTGRAWGIAEEVGKAVRWLEAMGLPGVCILSTYLSKDVDAQGPNNPNCPFLYGATYLDKRRPILETPPLFMPLLFVPFCAQMARVSQHELQVTWGQNTATLSKEGELQRSYLDGSNKAEPARVKRCDETSALRKSHTRKAINEDDWAILTRLGEATFAPDNRASQKGAGAGLTDND